MAGVPKRRPEVWKGEARIKRHHILVGGDVGLYKCLLGHLTGKLGKFGAEIDEHAVIVGAPEIIL